RRNLPEGRLLAVSMPGSRAANGMPARLVLPVIVAAAECKAVLRPDDLRPHFKADGLQRRLHGAGMPAGVPHIGDAAGEQRPGFAPVRPVVVGYLAELR